MELQVLPGSDVCSNFGCHGLAFVGDGDDDFCGAAYCDGVYDDP